MSMKYCHFPIDFCGELAIINVYGQNHESIFGRLQEDKWTQLLTC
jgi:hypothetical protein